MGKMSRDTAQRKGQKVTSGQKQSSKPEKRNQSLEGSQEPEQIDESSC